MYKNDQRIEKRVLNRTRKIRFFKNFFKNNFFFKKFKKKSAKVAYTEMVNVSSNVF